MRPLTFCLLFLPKEIGAIEIRIQDDALKLIQKGTEMISNVDSTIMSELKPDKDVLKTISNYAHELSKKRNSSFYYDEILTQQDAKEAEIKAWFVLLKILQLLNIELDSLK